MDRWSGEAVAPTNKAAVLRAEEHFFARLSGHGVLTLEIRFDDRRVSARELSAYLALVDGAFGRTDPRGFRSYALREDAHLRIENVESGSTVLEIVLAELHNVEMWRLIVTYLVLRTGPSILKGEAAKNWAESAKALGDAVLVWSDVSDRFSRARERPRLTRRQRSAVRAVIESDPLFEGLARSDVDVLVRLVEEVLLQESGHLTAAARFDDNHVLHIALRLRDNIGEAGN